MVLLFHFHPRNTWVVKFSIMTNIFHVLNAKQLIFFNKQSQPLPKWFSLVLETATLSHRVCLALSFSSIQILQLACIVQSYLSSLCAPTKSNASWVDRSDISHFEPSSYTTYMDCFTRSWININIYPIVQYWQCSNFEEKIKGIFEKRCSETCLKKWQQLTETTFDAEPTFFYS